MPVLRRESMLAVTVDNVMSWRLCDGYTRYRVKTLFAGREAITALRLCFLRRWVSNGL